MEGSRVEDCTSIKLVPSLEKTVMALTSNANHHEHLVALSIVVMGEMGFRVNEKNYRYTRNKREDCNTLDPEYWKASPNDNSNYQVSFKHESENELLDCKLIAIPIGDILALNLCPLRHFDNDITRTRTVAFPSFKYINPYSSDLSGRFMNLKEFSYRFKDNLATPIKGEILTYAGITNASLMGLPTELKLNILRMLHARDIAQIAQTCREFRDLCNLLRR